MKNNWAKAVVASVATLAVLGAVYFTGNANCLWALLLVIWLTESVY